MQKFHQYEAFIQTYRSTHYMTLYALVVMTHINITMVSTTNDSIELKLPDYEQRAPPLTEHLLRYHGTSGEHNQANTVQPVRLVNGKLMLRTQSCYLASVTLF